MEKFNKEWDRRPKLWDRVVFMKSRKSDCCPLWEDPCRNEAGVFFCVCPPSHPVFAKKYAALPLVPREMPKVLPPPQPADWTAPKGRVFTVGRKEGCRR